MGYLKTADELAEARGYFRFPQVAHLLRRVPAWFRSLGTDEGVAAWEARCGFRLPAAARESYRSPRLACFLDAATGSDVLLRDLALFAEGPFPPIARWGARESVVFASHGHSGMVMAAQFGADDPRVWMGFDDDPDPIVEGAGPPFSFSQWVYESVAGHEARLDHWQRYDEEYRSHPAASHPRDRVEWIRRLPGMADRMKR